MAIQFEQPLTAGTVLVRSDIRSQNFVAGSAGWRIEANGNAEFNSIVIRGGTVVSGLALYYNGTPALGNLIMSIAAAAGTDSFGNAYVKGVGLYGASGQLTAKDSAGNVARISGNIGGGGVLAALPGIEMQLAANAGDPAAIGALDDGTHTNLGLLLTSPSPVVGGLPGTDFSQIYMIGSDSAPTQISMDAANILINAATNINSSGVIDSYGSDAFNTYTPTISNGGTVTWTTRTGSWQRVGPMIYVKVNLTVNANGSGAGNIGVTMPTNIHNTLDTMIPARFTETRVGYALRFAGSAAAANVMERVRMQDGGAADVVANVTGADLTAGRQLTIEGWYRAA